MLDSETKRRIDTARDILVGKVPDPKSQVEQITIALVYKFMDDMDKQSIEMGGKASFFKGEFKKYSWTNIFDPRLGGVEMLNLYGEAITRMSQNSNLPELFRNIFKNAFLPYRDPETLKLFLKTINEFTYDHSEKLGDAFEYLLSVLGSQGDAGQFRTPRHIIDFMVQVIGPKKNETVLDPACGTAGFLISAYKYIVESNSKDPKGLKRPLGSGLNAQDKKRIYENFTGYDISPDMVRLSLVNLYLHGFVTPNIHEYDSLTSEDRWNEYADVILANPPFMSPKGGIQPHKRFSVQSNRSEVLFVDYMAEHLTPNGRAAIIVPEGIIFQSAGAYKQLRKYLIEHNYLWAVVSLPAGVFNPYAGVKTSILFLDKALAKKTDQILFVKVEADGFDLGAQRRPIDRNDLPDALNTLHAWLKAVQDGQAASFSPTIDSALLVSTSRLAENEDYNLSADRYREVARAGKQTYPMVKLGELIEYVRGVTYSKSDEVEDNGVFVLRANNINLENGILNLDDLKQIKPLSNLKEHQKLKTNDILICSASGSSDHIGKVAFSEKDTPYYIGGFMAAIRTNSLVEPKYLYFQLRDKRFREHIETASVGVNIKNLKSSTLSEFEIPLPPLEIQRQIVDEITAHQRIIDGARQVVEGWQPDIEINPDWEMVQLGELCELSQGFAVNAKTSHAIKDDGDMPLLRIKDLINNTFEQRVDSTLVPKNSIVNEDDLLYTRTGQIGLVFTGRKGVLHNNSFKIDFDKKRIEKNYLYNILQAKNIRDRIITLSTRSAQADITHGVFKSIEIPLPPLEAQREIVARIERERSIVEGNRELIRIYEEKVKKVIEKVWES